MPSLDSVLANIPGYAGFTAKRQANQQEDTGDLQQASALLGLRKTLEAQQREQQFRAGLRPDMTQEELAMHAAQFASPDRVLDVQQKSLDRQATLEVQRGAAADRRDAQKAAIDAKYDQMLQNAKNEVEKRALEQRRIEERAEADKRHDTTIRLIGEMRVQASQEKPPPGYRKTAAGNLEAIPGGPADQKLQGALNVDTASLNTSNANMDRLATAANEVMRHPGLGGITGMSGAVPNIPGSAAADAQAKLTTLKAQVGFGVLQELRNSSRTGGALGQVTEKEHVLLQNALAALEQAQSKEQMQESLQKIIEYTAGAKVRLQQAFNMRHAGGAAPAAPAAPQFQEGQTATGPNGAKIIFKGGQWQPATSQ